MIQMQRMGVVLLPETPEIKTVAKFNAGMTLAGNVVHMVFRYAEWRPGFDVSCQSNYAVDETRYARLTPEGKLVSESREALLKPSLDWDISGCQDARIVPFEGAYYLFYCGWDKDGAQPGHDIGRVGIARTQDFISAEKLGCVRHYTWDKDAYIFPERINGKIAYVHRVAPNIQLDYFDSFEELLNAKNWENYQDQLESSTLLRAAYPWECGKVGGSVPPIRTEAGWLFIYHAVEYLSENPTDFIYRAGVALLDLNDPFKVLARLPYPLLQPEEDYELAGDVDRVVFPVGGYVYNGDLILSYGGADRVVALAKVNLNELLTELQNHRFN